MTGSRRTMLAGLTAAGAFWSVAAPAQEFPDTTRAKIVEAFTYAYPVYEAARTRYRAAFAAPAEDSALNRLHHSRLLADHTSRWVTTPNNDTLYSTAFLDLTGGPVEITTPEFGDRYFSVAFMDAYTNNFAIIGRRATGGHPQRYLVVGPHWTGAAPPGDKLIRAPGDWVWTLVRTLIDGPADLDEAHRLQDGISLKPLTAGTLGRPVEPRTDDADTFLAVVDEAMAANPPPAADAPVLPRLAEVGVGPGLRAPSAEVLAAWRSLYPSLKTQLAAQSRAARAAGVKGGWTRSSSRTGDFGADYGLRATVGLSGLAALPPIEAIYAQPVADQSGAPLDDHGRYRLHLPPEGLPINAFWSLSAYELTPEGRLFFADNPIRRYAIGDRTKGLVKNPDGSLDILIQHDAPADPAAAANWLPLPAGPVRLSLRLYQPRPSLLTGDYQIPALQRLP